MHRNSNFELSYSQYKHNSKLREIEEKKLQQKQINILMLVYTYLLEERYFEAARHLKQECKINMDEYELCDNIDLFNIITDYESYFELRFHKLPKYCKKTAVCDGAKPPSTIEKKTIPIRRTSKVISPSLSEDNGSTTMHVHGTGVDKIGDCSGDLLQPCETRRRKEPYRLSSNDESLKDAFESISRDICSSLKTLMCDVIGLEDVKKTVMESLVYPMKFPSFFQGIMQPWKGLLLFGPPGTGKTLVARAVATECNATFFNITASTIISKWRGDTEKTIRLLFDMARHYEPSVIFFDEIDGLMSRRDLGAEHEGTRRLKTELLVQMDGLLQDNKHVFVLAATNIPWDLDPALLRRLEKRIYTRLPEEMVRKELFQHFLNQPQNSVEIASTVDFSHLSKVSDGYSASDILVVCKEALMLNIRTIIENLQRTGHQAVPVNCVTTESVVEALGRIKPTACQLVPKYVAWQQAHDAL